MAFFLHFVFEGARGGCRRFLAQADFLFAAQDRAGDFVGCQAQAAMAFHIHNQEAVGYQLADDVAPLVAGEFLADAVGGDFVMAELADAVGVGAEQDIDEMDGAEPLAGADDAGQGFLRGDGAVEHVGGGAAGIAIAAGLGEGFAEIFEQDLAAAAGTGAVADESFEFAAFEVFALFVGVAAFDHRAEFGGVFDAVDEEGFGREAVAAGAACFLIIGFDAFGQIHMRDEADVGFIDTHAEGDGGDDDDGVFLEEFILMFGAQVGG